MSSKENTFDKIIKSKMEGYEILPEEDFWNSIESAVSRKRKIYRLVKVISVAFIVVIGSYFLYKKTVSNSSSSSNEVNEGSLVAPIKDQVNFETQSKNASQSNQTHQIDQSQEYLSKQQIMHREEQLDSTSINRNVSQEESFKEGAFVHTLGNPDSLNIQSTPIEKAVPKKVVKKPVYIVQQDTIFKVDTLKVKKKKIK